MLRHGANTRHPALLYPPVFEESARPRAAVRSGAAVRQCHVELIVEPIGASVW